MSNRMPPMIQLPQKNPTTATTTSMSTSLQQHQQPTTTVSTSGSTSSNIENSNIINNNNNVEIISTIPTLRVMRLQKPELHSNSSNIATTTCLSSVSSSSQSQQLLIETNPFILHSSLCLPDSLTVYVGETFTAYLGVLNTPNTTTTSINQVQHQSSSSTPPTYTTIRRLTVVAQLQTPSQRYPLPSRLDPQSLIQNTYTTTTNTQNTNVMGIDILPFHSVDAIVSHPIIESGPHILRVEVKYYTSISSDTNNNNNYNHIQQQQQQQQSFRKFYRFNVIAPLHIIEKYTIRTSDTSCYTNIMIEYPNINNNTTNNNNSNNNSTITPSDNHNTTYTDPLVLSSFHFDTPDGLTAINITDTSMNQNVSAIVPTIITNDDSHDNDDNEHDDQNDKANTMDPTITNTSLSLSKSNTTTAKTAIELYDNDTICILPGDSISLLYYIQTNTKQSSIRGIAIGDLLGQLQLKWYKAMGECGIISSTTSIYCPKVGTNKYNNNNNINSNNTNINTNNINSIDDRSNKTSTTTTANTPTHIMNRAGLSVDIAATAAAMTLSSLDNNSITMRNDLSSSSSSSYLSLITVEPIDPPLQMQLYVPNTVSLLVTNHSPTSCTLQVQFDIPTTNGNNNIGIVVSGTTYQNIGTIHGYGKSITTQFTFIPIQKGLISIQYCTIMDVTSGQCIPIPSPLWNTFVI